MLLTEKLQYLTEDEYRNIDANSNFLSYAAKIADGARAIRDYIQSLYAQIPEKEYEKDDESIDAILTDRLCAEIFTTKAFMTRLTYEPGSDAVADFVVENRKRISQLFSENEIISNYVTRF